MGPLSAGIRIPLSRKGFALVDAEDAAEVLAAGPWHRRQNRTKVYAQRHIVRNGIRTTQQMHQFIIGATGVDHRNRDGLDNRRSNLRVADQSNNMANVPGRPGTSQFKGVHFRRDRGYWVAQIRVRGKSRELGHFDDESDAARAYDSAALKAFGEFAYLNFPVRALGVGDEPSREDTPDDHQH